MCRGRLSGCIGLFKGRQPCFITDDYPLPDDVLDGCRVMGEHRPEFHYLYRPGQLFVHPDDFAAVRERLGDDVDAEAEPTPYPEILVARVREDRLLPRVIARDLAGLRVGPHLVFRTASHIHVTPNGPPHDRVVVPSGQPAGQVTEATARRVAVLDTGVNLSDPVIGTNCTGDGETAPAAGAVLPPFSGHGTFIAGTIIAKIPNIRIESVNMMGGNGLVEDAKLAYALKRFETDRVDVINLSAASQVFRPEMVQTVAQLETLLRLQPRLVIVAAAGNDASSAETYPAAMPEVIGVAAVRKQGTRACFSNWGGWVNASAIGVDRVSRFLTYNGKVHVPPTVGSCPKPNPPDSGVRQFNGWARWSGTSFATPVVTAAVVRHLAAGETRKQILGRYPKKRAGGIGTFVAG